VRLQKTSSQPDILSICNVEPKAEIQYAGADDKTHGTNMQNSVQKIGFGFDEDKISEKDAYY
jgi:hypothetical protein